MPQNKLTSTFSLNFFSCSIHFPHFKTNVMNNALALSTQTQQSLSTDCWEGLWTDQTLRIPALCVNESQVIDVHSAKHSEIKGSDTTVLPISYRKDREKAGGESLSQFPKEIIIFSHLIGTLCKVPLAALTTSCCCQFEFAASLASFQEEREKPHHKQRL